MYVHSISVDSYRVDRRLRCVQYALRVQGLTVYLHPMCFYDPECCLVRDLATFTHWARFSLLAMLHKRLMSEFPYLKLPRFPRHWFPVRSTSGIQSRIRQLNAYFATLLDIECVQISEILQDFLRPRSLNLRIVGSPGVGKMRLLEGFFRARRCSMEYRLPGIRDGGFQQSGMYPDRSYLPVDLVVDQALVRISFIGVDSLTSGKTELEGADGIVFAYSESMPESLNAVWNIREKMDVDSAVVALDEGTQISKGQFAARSCADVYNVFEYLIRRHIKGVAKCTEVHND